nr:integrase, catalytic region, zinc finger, CCHC-type, peptidase aspartic, catalytic [Tanacetum cinerariifolium]
PGVKFCAGKCGLRSWERCGGGGVGWKVGESGVKGMAGKPGSGATVPAILNQTRPPMLDRTDFASWQQRIRLYCRGKENGVNILKSIDEGPYHIGIVRETLAESTKGIPQYGPERPQAYSDLTSEEKDCGGPLLNGSLALI